MRILRAGAAAMLLSLAGCNDDSMPGACTASFAMIGVTVIDGAGQPVPGASVTATLVRTGEVLVPMTLMLMEPGTYVLVDDGSTSLIRRSGDAVEARIAKGAMATTAEYVIALEGGCHVTRISGPDTVTLQ